MTDNEIEELSQAINRGIEKAIAAFDKELKDTGDDFPYSIELTVVEMYEDVGMDDSSGYIPHKTYKIKREP